MTADKKAIIFDLDGNLWDSREAVAKSYNKALKNIKDVDRIITVDDLTKTMGKTMDVIARILFDKVSPERALQILEECSRVELEEVAVSGGVLYPELEKTLFELKKSYKLMIVSNCQEGYIETFFSAHKLGYLFDDYENWGRTGLSKGENIALVIERNKIEKAVYVGDTDGDYISACEANVPFIHAAYGFGKPHDSTPFIKEISKLPEKVRQILDN